LVTPIHPYPNLIEGMDFLEKNVKNLLDYESISEKRWTEELKNIFPKEQEKAITNAKIISDTIKKFIPVIKEYL
jgi:hypothetical protein